MVSGEETGILSAKAMVDVLSSLRELGASDNLVFSKIASDQCIREQNLAWASARVIWVSLVMVQQLVLLEDTGLSLSGDLLAES